MYETEEQQVEALKKWWKENGKSIIGGIVIGLGAVFGWQAWQQHTNTVAAQASNLFDQLSLAVAGGQSESVEKQAQQLHDEFASTPYAEFAYLMQARVAYEKGDATVAAVALEKAIAGAPDPAIKAIAVLRLARVRLDTGDAAAAAALLRQHPASDAFAGEFAMIEGDVALAKGDVEAARKAYRTAIENQAGNPDLVQLKLENLPPAS